jgi:hypothetical protein
MGVGNASILQTNARISVLEMTLEAIKQWSN